MACAQRKFGEGVFHESSKDYEDLKRSLMIMLLYLIPCIKHHSYKEKQETRMIFKLLTVDDEKIPCKYLQDMNSQDKIKIKEFLSTNLKPIILGLLAFKKSVDINSWGCFLKKYLVGRGTLIDVSSSDIPVRG